MRALVVFLHAIGRDHDDWREHAHLLPYRVIAPTQVGFESHAVHRFRLSTADQLAVTRALVSDLVTRLAPRTTVVVGHSAGADLAMRLLAECDDEERPPVDALLALEPSFALETCNITQLLAGLGAGDEVRLLEKLAAMSEIPENVVDWVILYDYLVKVISKLRDDIEVLRVAADGIVEPFRAGGSGPFLDWYQTVSARVACLRCVFSGTPVCNSRILKLRLEHLDTGCPGEHHREESIVVDDDVTHLGLHQAPRVASYLEKMLADLERSRGR